MLRATGLTKVFGAREQEALRLAGEGIGRDEILQRTGSTLAVHDVGFSVERGELFVIMGLSGSGKSTLVRLLNRLIEPSAGTVEVDGQDLRALGDADLRALRNDKVSMVFQHFALLPHRTVRENAAYALKVRGVAAAEQRERADWALRTVGLLDRADARPDELSGGMQQRVGLARALAADSDVLLMDEPFSALDPLIRRDMQDLLVRLQTELRKTIVFITHDLNEAMRLGDRILMLKDGRTVQLGTGPEIISAPADDYVADFTSDVDRTRVLTAGDLLREPRMTARLGQSTGEVLRTLGAAEANGVYVLDGDRRVAGVARDDLLARALQEGRTAVGPRELVADYATIAPDRPLVEFVHLVGRHPVPLGVVDDDGRLLGVVPRAAVLDALAAVPARREG
ncbi:glycine betaine/proline transport system ATP-binding protein [Geodermatophilus bullaregiensis]|uniref:quaternary amine ABC transporter ATP-binding protein n=1 Tax=Geodermatophilus bullaregiensis TaxID=1564160 RepID=UPI0027DE58B7|nr:glycine betaine/L-proline ABC transporter ATP-binding protein [Geodermatophilus bullaregiensis]MBM7805702.1 glycine betaine/proline transport system ATP-binding protein [Geodermatophilus bullaregiensis]